MFKTLHCHIERSIIHLGQCQNVIFSTYSRCLNSFPWPTNSQNHEHKLHSLHKLCTLVSLAFKDTCKLSWTFWHKFHKSFPPWCHMKVVTNADMYWPPLHIFGHYNLLIHIKSTCPLLVPLVKLVLCTYLLPVSHATQILVIFHVTKFAYAGSDPMQCTWPWLTYWTLQSAWCTWETCTLHYMTRTMIGEIVGHNRLRS